MKKRSDNNGTPSRRDPRTPSHKTPTNQRTRAGLCVRACVHACVRACVASGDALVWCAWSAVLGKGDAGGTSGCPVSDVSCCCHKLMGGFVA